MHRPRLPDSFSAKKIRSSAMAALPTQIPWSHIVLLAGTPVHLYNTLSPNGGTWPVQAFPKTRTNAVLPSFFTWNLVKLHAV